MYWSGLEESENGMLDTSIEILAVAVIPASAGISVFDFPPL